MGERSISYGNRERAAAILEQDGGEFVVIENPKSVFPPFETYPLPPKRYALDDGLRAVFVDLDGTITSTETLYLNVLEAVARSITGRRRDDGWAGLDEARDYPHLVGNSVTKHVEYLLDRFAPEFNLESFGKDAAAACAANEANPFDDARLRDTRATASALALEDGFERLRDPLLQILAGVEIYYQQLYSKMRSDDPGRWIRLAPGVGLFHAVLHGCLNDVETLNLEAALGGTLPEADSAERLRTVRTLSRYFARAKPTLAVVTSCSGPEADFILRSAFTAMAEEVDAWDLEPELAENVRAVLADHRTYYDGVYTASLVPEFRVKPHRDIYSAALNALGIPPAQFHRVVVLEDTEVGIVAARAAGLPLTCAVPLPESFGHDFHAASHVLKGGLAEAMFDKQLFLPPDALEEANQLTRANKPATM